jgi:hypothetical protein
MTDRTELHAFHPDITEVGNKAALGLWLRACL